MPKIVLANAAAKAIGIASSTDREAIRKTPINRAPLPIAAKQLAVRANVSKTSCELFSFNQVDFSGAPICQSVNSQKMTVCGLNHFNITASRVLIEQVKQFYTEVVGLELGPRAHLNHDGYWLYAGAMPIVHLSVAGNMEPVLRDAKGYFNHISLSCVGLKSAIAKMKATQTPYRLIQLLDIHQTQLFITDPAGTGVELTFFNEAL